MKINKLINKIISLGVLVSFLSTTLLAPFAQASLWDERRSAIEEINKHKEEETLLAYAGPTLNLNPITHSPSPSQNQSFIQALIKSGLRMDARYQSLRWLEQAISGSMDLDSLYLPESWKPGDLIVAHVQDAHENISAQKNIARGLGKLTEESPNLLVGVEGAEGAFSLNLLRAIPGNDLKNAVAGTLLNGNYITGSEYAGVTSAKAPELWGIENEGDYVAHVNAFKQAAKSQKEMKNRFALWQKELNKEKESVLNPALKSLDQNRIAYHNDQLPLGKYIQALMKDETQSYPQLERYLNAAKLEEGFDKAKLEKERKSMLEFLVKNLGAEALKRFQSMAVAYRTGEWSHGKFYKSLSELCGQKAIKVSQWPQMQLYVQYVQISEALNAKELFKEMAALEQAKVKRLAKSEAEANLLQKSEQLILVGKLIEFKLTPESWDQYLAARDSIVKNLSHDFPQAAEALSQFEQFNRAAVRRNDVLLKNLLAKWHKRGTKDSKEVAVLLTGGFHTTGMVELMKAQRVAHAVIRPKLEAAQGGGTAYLEQFLRSKRPIEQIFTGEKIRLATRPTLALSSLMDPRTGVTRGLTAALVALGLSRSNDPKTLQTELEQWIARAQVQNLKITVSALRDGSAGVRVVIEQDGHTIPLQLHTAKGKGFTELSDENLTLLETLPDFMGQGVRIYAENGTAFEKALDYIRAALQGFVQQAHDLVVAETQDLTAGYESLCLLLQEENLPRAVMAATFSLLHIPQLHPGEIGRRRDVSALVPYVEEILSSENSLEAHRIYNEGPGLVNPLLIADADVPNVLREFINSGTITPEQLEDLSQLLTNDFSNQYTPVIFNILHQNNIDFNSFINRLLDENRNIDLRRLGWLLIINYIGNEDEALRADFVNYVLGNQTSLLANFSRDWSDFSANRFAEEYAKTIFNRIQVLMAGHVKFASAFLRVQPQSTARSRPQHSSSKRAVSPPRNSKKEEKEGALEHKESNDPGKKQRPTHLLKRQDVTTNFSYDESLLKPINEDKGKADDQDLQLIMELLSDGISNGDSKLLEAFKKSNGALGLDALMDKYILKSFQFGEGEFDAQSVKRILAGNSRINNLVLLELKLTRNRLDNTNLNENDILKAFNNLILKNNLYELFDDVNSLPLTPYIFELFDQLKGGQELSAKQYNALNLELLRATYSPPQNNTDPETYLVKMNRIKWLMIIFYAKSNKMSGQFLEYAVENMEMFLNQFEKDWGIQSSGLTPRKEVVFGRGAALRAYRAIRDLTNFNGESAVDNDRHVRLMQKLSVSRPHYAHDVPAQKQGDENDVKSPADVYRILREMVNDNATAEQLKTLKKLFGFNSAASNRTDYSMAIETFMRNMNITNLEQFISKFLNGKTLEFKRTGWLLISYYYTRKTELKREFETDILQNQGLLLNELAKDWEDHSSPLDAGIVLQRFTDLMAGNIGFIGELKKLSNKQEEKEEEKQEENVNIQHTFNYIIGCAERLGFNPLIELLSKKPSIELEALIRSYMENADNADKIKSILSGLINDPNGKNALLILFAIAPYNMMSDFLSDSENLSKFMLILNSQPVIFYEVARKLIKIAAANMTVNNMLFSEAQDPESAFASKFLNGMGFEFENIELEFKQSSFYIELNRMRTDNFRTEPVMALNPSSGLKQKLKNIRDSAMGTMRESASAVMSIFGLRKEREEDLHEEGFDINVEEALNNAFDGKPNQLVEWLNDGRITDKQKDAVIRFSDNNKTKMQRICISMLSDDSLQGAAFTLLAIGEKEDALSSLLAVSANRNLFIEKLSRQRIVPAQVVLKLIKIAKKKCGG